MNKKLGLIGVVAGALTAAVIGGAGPAQADDNGHGFSGNGNDFGYGYYYDHDRRNNPWLDQIYPSVKVPRVDTSVRN